MKRYRWPGNIRELENLMRRLAALYPQESINEQLVDVELSADAAGFSPTPVVESAAPVNGHGEDAPPLGTAVERHLSEGLRRARRQRCRPPACTTASCASWSSR